ncbi:MAG: AAA family ATPase, partial [Myxococcota bacterium]
MSFAEAIERWKTEGRASLENGRIKFAPARDEPPREVLRRAYQWIVDRAVVCGAPDLSTGTSSYASYVLLPLLTLVTRQRLLIVGAPGRGKTTIATLMALLSGETLSQVRRNTQHGHPQLTTADLLGGPLPGNLVEAKTASDV